MNVETNRLNTFNNWPASAPVDPIRIAKAGFFYTGEGTEVQCFSCGGKISDWNYGDQVMWRHRRMEPNCSFVVNSQLSGNVALVLGQESPSAGGDLPTSWSPPDEHNDLVETTRDYGLTEEDQMYRNDVLRLLSFTNWDDDSVSSEALVTAGFYHTGGGRLRCAWCGGELAPFRRFGSLGPPIEVHRMYFPRCDFAAALEVANQPTDISSTSSPPSDTPPLPSSPSETVDNQSSNQSQSSGAAHNEQLLNMGGTWRTLGVVSGGARHPQQASLASRLASFERWPADRQQSPKDLAEAGFFHTGIDDQVRCFYCDGGLGMWEAGDTPWSEHARWFPHCGYVLLIKGQDFVESCSNLPSVQRTVSAESGLSSRSRNPLINFPVIENQIEDCMESPIALAALAAGLDAARVRRAWDRRLRLTGFTFHTSEALINVVLEDQLNEEAWNFVPQSQRFARDILADTLREVSPRFGIIPTQWEDRPYRRRTQSETLPRSLSPVQRPHQLHIPETDSNENVTNVNSPVTSTGTDVRNTVTDAVESPKKDVVKQLSLEEENRQLKEARLCKVCMDSEVGVVFLPCGHLVSCAKCGAALSACPLCRCSVRALVRAYLA